MAGGQGCGATMFARWDPTTAGPRKNSPSTAPPAALPRKTRPARQKTPILGHCERAGRTFSRTRRDNVATLKPTTPLRAPNKGPLKPASPLRPKIAPKTPISHPQRRWRFQSRLGRHPQRRQWFQSQTSTSEQRRWRFQTSGPPGRQSLTTAPAGGGRAWPGDQWAADVTNVVKLTRFTSPREDPCYKRRQSEPKNRHFQRKSPRIDDVCNNGTESQTKNTLD